MRSNGDVCLCCRSPAVGNIKETPMEAILEGPQAQGMRRQLLAGELSEDCLVCSERGTTTREGLRRDVEHLLYEEGRDEVEELRRENLELKQVRSDLMRERAALLGHVRNLENERPHLQGHIENLERERAQLLRHPEKGSHRFRLHSTFDLLVRLSRLLGRRRNGAGP